MVKLNRESLEAFQSVLETVDDTWQTDFNLRETVRQSFALIKKAREYKVSWEKIADLLKQSSGVDDGISPESIRQYYFEFSKQPELLPKKKRKSSSTKPQPKIDAPPTSASDTTEKNSSTVGEAIPLPSEPVTASEPIPQSAPVPETSSSTPELQPPTKADVKSQFNLKRRGS